MILFIETLWYEYHAYEKSYKIHITVEKTVRYNLERGNFFRFDNEVCRKMKKNILKNISRKIF